MELDKLRQELFNILNEIIDKEAVINDHIQNVHPDYQPSAKNLLRYLLLRSFDLRKYHGALSDLGISSIRSSEGYVYSNLYNVVNLLNLIEGKQFGINPDIEIIGYTRSQKLLRQHADTLFDKTKRKHFTDIMVTMPDEAAENEQLVRDMALQGMDIARINLSKGDIVLWRKMINTIQKASEATGKRIRIYMDLGGPKIRTSSFIRRGKKRKSKKAVEVAKGDPLRLMTRAALSQREREGVRHEEDFLMMSVTLDALIYDAAIGDQVLFDDGMIRSRVVNQGPDYIDVEITESYKTKIGSKKGINLPDTKLNLPALTEKDLEVLPFACRYADIIGYSFVKTSEDVKKLFTELEKYIEEKPGVVFKIENRIAFNNLPEILLEGMKYNKIGVMIARGDLAVEIGFERISEVQNEILWLCESAHVPVIWATQVLENLAKTGIPTRAEISDAAQAVQAECVMLNKGPHIVEAVRVLKDILIRMQGHQFKKKNELRPLNVAKAFAWHLNNYNAELVSE